MELIKKWEGCKLKAYKCPAGVWTIGYGSTIYLDGSPVKKGDIIDLEYADKLLKEHLRKEIILKLPEELKQILTQNQAMAVESLVYNVGIGAFLRSKLYRAIMDNDYFNIINNWDWYSATVNGKRVRLKGLYKRRVEELNLFIQDI